MPHTPSIVFWSKRVYQQLLRFYPKSFFERYGAEMAQAFEDLCREAYARAGIRGITGLWFRTLGDLLVNVIAEILGQLRARTNAKLVLSEGLKAQAMNQNSRGLSNSVLRTGLFYGLVLGGLLSVYTVAGTLLQVNTLIGTILNLYAYALIFLLCVLAGFRASYTTGRGQAGMWAGLIAGCVSMLFMNLLTVAISITFFDYLRQHALEDRDFVRSGLSDYGTFLVDDLLGGLVIGTTFNTVLGAVLGAFGAFVSKGYSSQPTQLR